MVLLLPAERQLSSVRASSVAYKTQLALTLTPSAGSKILKCCQRRTTEKATDFDEDAHRLSPWTKDCCRAQALENKYLLGTDLRPEVPPGLRVQLELVCSGGPLYQPHLLPGSFVAIGAQLALSLARDFGKDAHRPSPWTQGCCGAQTSGNTLLSGTDLGLEFPPGLKVQLELVWQLGDRFIDYTCP